MKPKSSPPFWTPRGCPEVAGPLRCGAMATRVAVFIDYQNVYMGARHAFCQGTASHVDGQIRPRRSVACWRSGGKIASSPCPPDR